MKYRCVCIFTVKLMLCKELASGHCKGPVLTLILDLQSFQGVKFLAKFLKGLDSRPFFIICFLVARL